MTGEILEIYVIYHHPRDYPDEFVIRVWAMAGGLIIDNQVLGRAHTLTEARGLLPRGLLNRGRHDNEDPAIAEIWT